jgi:long-chain fatty acid transport protein
MTRRMQVAFWLSSAALTAVAASSAAHAGGFALREQSAYGLGMAFAGIGAGGSLSSMFWNPATLSAVEKFQTESIINVILPESEVSLDPIAGLGFPGAEEGDIARDALVPASYVGFRLNDRLVLGLGVNGPFGLSTKYDQDSILRTFGIAGTSEVFSLNANPAVAYQVNDWLTLALGAQVQYIDLKYTQQALPGFGGVGNLEGDDIGLGLTAGVQIKPFAGTEIGVGYRSGISHELEGDLSLIGGAEVDARADGFDLPDLVTLGLRQSITDTVRVSAGAEWSNWSRFETVELSGGGASQPLGFDYEDGWFFSVGAEVDVTQRLTLRGGIGYELSPIDEDTRTFRLPDNDRLWLSAGASYRPNDRWTFDAAYTFLKSDDTEILSAAEGGPPANGPFSGDADSHVHLIAVAVKRKFGGKPHYDPPLVTK